jgi:hypothetical protein
LSAEPAIAEFDLIAISARRLMPTQIIFGEITKRQGEY